MAATFAGCSEDGSNPASPEETGTESGSSSNSDSKDKTSTTIKDSVSVGDGYETPYYSEGIFCWTEGCESKFSSSSAKPASSTSKPTSTASSSSKPASSAGGGITVEKIPEPTVVGFRMIDERDQHEYQLEDIDGKLWMAENLMYKPASGTTCIKNDKDEDFCELYGMYYDYTTAKKACPGGWHLPTKDEFNAAWKYTTAKEDGLDWWTLGGRIKDGTNGQEGSIGYIWLTKDADGSITVQYQKNSTEFLKNERAYNVRCVQD